jgi:hypothetical protein
MPDFETELRTDAVDLAKRYAFFPSDRAKDFRFSDGAVNTPMQGAYKGFKHSMINHDKKIARVNLELQSGSRGETLNVIPKITGGAGVPVYFLPWDETGAAVGMTIPDADPNLPEDQHPKIFFTAVLSGCMIAFKGSLQRPTVYHCGTAGGETGTATGGNNSNEFFSNLLSRANLMGLGPRGAIGGKIKSTDYMVPRSGSDTVAQLEADLTADIQQILGLRKKSGSGFLLQQVRCWGVCFGIRKGADWKFYMQENASIYYDAYSYKEVLGEMEFQKKTWWGGSKTVTRNFITNRKFTTTKQVAKPIKVVRVYPGGGTAKITNSWKVLE